MGYCYWKNGKLHSVPDEPVTLSDSVHTEFDFDDVVDPDERKNEIPLPQLPKGAFNHIQAAMRKATTPDDFDKIIQEIVKYLNMEMSFKDRQTLNDFLEGAKRNKIEAQRGNR